MFELSISPLFHRFFYYILEKFRQCGSVWFSYYYSRIPYIAVLSIYKYISNVLDQVGVDKSENVGYAIITIHFLLEHPT